jgi:hypothetical protein
MPDPASPDVEDLVRTGLAALVADAPDPAGRGDQLDARLVHRQRGLVQRRRFVTGAAAAAAVAAGAGITWRVLDREEAPADVATGPTDPTDPARTTTSTGGSWRQVPPARSLLPRQGVAQAWLGDRLFLWGGTWEGAEPQDAGTWVPGDDRWTRIDPETRGTRGIGSVGGPHFAVWNGEEALVGMCEADSNAPWNADLQTNDLGYGLRAFDPADGSWRDVALLARDSEVVRNGSGRQAVLLADGRLLVGVTAALPDGGRPEDLIAVDVETGEVQPVPLGPFAASPYADASGSVSLTGVGDVVLAVPTWDRRPWMLDPIAGTWVQLAAPPDRQSLHLLPATSIGTRAVLRESDGEEMWILDPLAGPDGTWTAVAPNPHPRARWSYEPVWSGTGLYVPGAAYDPAADTWRAVDPPPRGPDRQRTLVGHWAAGSLLLFGGEEYSCPDDAECDRTPGPETLDGWITSDP